MMKQKSKIEKAKRVTLCSPKRPIGTLNDMKDSNRISGWQILWALLALLVLIFCLAWIAVLPAYA